MEDYILRLLTPNLSVKNRLHISFKDQIVGYVLAFLYLEVQSTNISDLSGTAKKRLVS